MSGGSEVFWELEAEVDGTLEIFLIEEVVEVITRVVVGLRVVLSLAVVEVDVEIG